MNYAESFRFVFRQPAWPTKLLVLLGLTLVPVVGWILISGYLLAVTRNVIRGEEPILPAWTNFGRLFADGLKLVVVVIVWNVVPWIFDLVTNAIDIAILDLLDFIVQLVFSVLVIGATGALAATGNLADGLGVPAIITRVRTSPRPYVTAAIASAVIAIVAAVGLLIPGLVLAFVLALILPIGFGIVLAITIGFLLYAFVGLSAAHLTGQAHREASGSPLPAAPRF